MAQLNLSEIEIFPMQRLPAIICNRPHPCVEIRVYAGNDSGRYRIYGHREVTQRLLISVRARGSSSLWVVGPWFPLCFLDFDVFLAKGAVQVEELLNA